MGYLTVACQALLGVTFFVAVGSKLRSADAYAEFRRSLPTLRIVPRSHAATLAVAAVAAEAVAAVLVLVPAAAVVGFALSGLLLTLFTGVVLRAVLVGSAANCRCFGATQRPLGIPHVVRNLILLAVAVTGGASTIVGAYPRSGLAGLVIAGTTGAIVAAMLIRIDDIADLFGPPPRVGARRLDS